MAAPSAYSWIRYRLERQLNNRNDNSLVVNTPPKLHLLYSVVMTALGIRPTNTPKVLIHDHHIPMYQAAQSIRLQRDALASTLSQSPAWNTQLQQLNQLLAAPQKIPNMPTPLNRISFLVLARTKEKRTSTPLSCTVCHAVNPTGRLWFRVTVIEEDTICSKCDMYSHVYIRPAFCSCVEYQPRKVCINNIYRLWNKAKKPNNVKESLVTACKMEKNLVYSFVLRYRLFLHDNIIDLVRGITLGVYGDGSWESMWSCGWRGKSKTREIPDDSFTICAEGNQRTRVLAKHFPDCRICTVAFNRYSGCSGGVATHHKHHAALIWAGPNARVLMGRMLREGVPLWDISCDSCVCEANPSKEQWSTNPDSCILGVVSDYDRSTLSSATKEWLAVWSTNGCSRPFTSPPARQLNDRLQTNIMLLLITALDTHFYRYINVAEFTQLLFATLTNEQDVIHALMGCTPVASATTGRQIPVDFFPLDMETAVDGHMICGSPFTPQVYYGRGVCKSCSKKTRQSQEYTNKGKQLIVVELVPYRFRAPPQGGKDESIIDMTVRITCSYCATTMECYSGPAIVTNFMLTAPDLSIRDMSPFCLIGGGMPDRPLTLLSEVFLALSDLTICPWSDFLNVPLTTHMFNSSGNLSVTPSMGTAHSAFTFLEVCNPQEAKFGLRSGFRKNNNGGVWCEATNHITPHTFELLIEVRGKKKQPNIKCTIRCSHNNSWTPTFKRLNSTLTTGRIDDWGTISPVAKTCDCAACTNTAVVHAHGIAYDQLGKDGSAWLTQETLAVDPQRASVATTDTNTTGGSLPLLYAGVNDAVITGMGLTYSRVYTNDAHSPIGTLRPLMNHTALGRLVPQLWSSPSKFNPLGSATLWHWAMQVFDRRMLLTCRPPTETKNQQSPFFTPEDDNHMTTLVFFASGHGPCGCTAPWKLSADLSSAKPITPQSNNGSRISVVLYANCTHIECSVSLSKTLHTALYTVELGKALATVCHILPEHLQQCTSSDELIQALQPPNHCWWQKQHALQSEGLRWSLQLIDYLHPAIDIKQIETESTNDFFCRLTKTMIAAWRAVSPKKGRRKRSETGDNRCTADSKVVLFCQSSRSPPVYKLGYTSWPDVTPLLDELDDVVMFSWDDLTIKLDKTWSLVWYPDLMESTQSVVGGPVTDPLLFAAPSVVSVRNGELFKPDTLNMFHATVFAYVADAMKLPILYGGITHTKKAIIVFFPQMVWHICTVCTSRGLLGTVIQISVHGDNFLEAECLECNRAIRTREGTLISKHNWRTYCANGVTTDKWWKNLGYTAAHVCGHILYMTVHHESSTGNDLLAYLREILRRTPDANLLTSIHVPSLYQCMDELKCREEHRVLLLKWLQETARSGMVKSKMLCSTHDKLRKGGLLQTLQLVECSGADSSFSLHCSNRRLLSEWVDTKCREIQCMHAKLKVADQTREKQKRVVSKGITARVEIPRRKRKRASPKLDPEDTMFTMLPWLTQLSSHPTHDFNDTADMTAGVNDDTTGVD